MISTSGMTPYVGITLVRENRETFETDVRNEPTAEREIEAFRERIGEITTVDDLIDDYEVFSFVMKAFGMEDEIYAKAMMKQIITSDPEDDSSLVNKLTDSNYKSINEELGFDTEGIAGSNFTDPDWVDQMVERYVDQRLIDTQSEVNESVGLALTFEQKIEGMDSWYEVLADQEVAEFMMTAFGMSDTYESADIDAQERMLASRMDIEELQDPEVREQLIRQFAAFAGASESETTTSAAMQILSAGSDYSMVTIDIDLIQGFSGSAYS